MDQTMRQVNRRFAPWLHAALWVLLATGLLLIVGEPVRELITFSFWAKMTLLAISVAIALLFSRAVRTHEDVWDEALARRGSVRAMAVGALVVWFCIIVLGRLIAYDHVWGPLSPAARY
jgi:putative copper export protein